MHSKPQGSLSEHSEVENSGLLHCFLSRDKSIYNDRTNEHTSIKQPKVTDQKFEYGIDEGAAVLVDESVDLRTQTKFDGESGQTQADVNAKELLDWDTEDFAVTEDAVRGYAGAYIEEGVAGVEVVELAGTDDRGCAAVEFSVGVERSSSRAAVGPGEDGGGGGQKSDEDGGHAHLACFLLLTTGNEAAGGGKRDESDIGRRFVFISDFLGAICIAEICW